MGGALYCASLGGAISKISTMLLHCHGSATTFEGPHAVLSVLGANVLGCSGDDPLKSLDFSLSLHRIVLTRHLLFTKAAVVDTVRVIEEETRFLVLVAGHPGMSAGQNIGLQGGTKGRAALTSTTESRRRWPRHDAQLPMMGATKEKKQQRLGCREQQSWDVARSRSGCVSLSVGGWFP